MRRALTVLLTTLAACSSIQPSPQVVTARSANWHTAITPEDRIRLRAWRQTFLDALAQARASYPDAIARKGALLDPDAAIAGPPIPDGLYRCRTIKLGAKPPATRTYADEPPSTCEVRKQGQLQMFARLTGTQREIGSIFPSDGLRQVFLGTLVLGDETRSLHYGTDEQRDVAGYVERVGPNRWRLVLPAPHFESRFDVIEMVPAA